MKKKELENLRNVTEKGLLEIGFRSDLFGYKYLCYATELIVQQPELREAICSKLYVLVGEHFGVSSSCVERSIRVAISNVKRNKGFGKLDEFFGSHLFENGKHPTSGELICLMAEYYNLGLYEDNNKK